MSGNTFNNTGDFRGAAMFQGSTINNAGQIAGTMVAADTTSRGELQALLKQLGEALRPVPPEQVEDAEATAAAAEDLVKEAANDNPTPSRLRSLGDMLVGAAKAVGAAAPAALSIADKVVALIGKIHGLG
jgi:hypothetical protein